MGVIEELAAKDAARQALGRAKQAEMGRVMNQGEQGLAATVADPYLSGISQEDLHKLALVKQAQDANTGKSIMEMIAKNREYNTAKKNDAIASQPKYETFDDGNGTITQNEIYTPTKYRTVEDGAGGLTFEEIQPTTTADQRTILKYKESIDPGLAAKWMSSYKGR